MMSVYKNGGEEAVWYARLPSPFIRIYDSSATCQRVADFAFSNVTEGFVNVINIATIDVSVNICRKELRATRRATGVWRSFVHVTPAVLASVVVALQKCHQLARSSWL